MENKCNCSTGISRSEYAEIAQNAVVNSRENVELKIELDKVKKQLEIITTARSSFLNLHLAFFNKIDKENKDLRKFIDERTPYYMKIINHLREKYGIAEEAYEAIYKEICKEREERLSDCINDCGAIVKYGDPITHRCYKGRT